MAASIKSSLPSVFSDAQSCLHQAVVVPCWFRPVVTAAKHLTVCDFPRASKVGDNADLTDNYLREHPDTFSCLNERSSLQTTLMNTGELLLLASKKLSASTDRGWLILFCVIENGFRRIGNDPIS
ncbi:MAG TPA: hypothetical protein VHK70_10570 [Burkholderiaceae bacterium]|jgi:hypothetical protein|nr:hypothetical protein [Burkholderiaceae bacterium]